MTINKPTLLEENIVAKNEFVQVNMDKLRFPGGAERSHLKVSPVNGSGVVVIAIDTEDNVYLHQAYHYAANTTQIEFIRGFSDPNESETNSAMRELDEEISVHYNVVEPAIKIGSVLPDSTLLNSEVSIFKVRISVKGEVANRVDQEESLGKGYFVSLEHLENMIQQGKIKDGFTLSALSLLKVHR